MALGRLSAFVILSRRIPHIGGSGGMSGDLRPIASATELRTRLTYLSRAERREVSRLMNAGFIGAAVEMVERLTAGLEGSSSDG